MSILCLILEVMEQASKMDILSFIVFHSICVISMMKILSEMTAFQVRLAQFIT
jgi:hypothetical protein